VVTPSEQVEPLGPLVIPAPRWTKVVTLAASVIVVVALGIALVSVAGQSSSPKVSAVASLRHLDGPVEASGSAVVHVLPSALEMSVSTRNLPAAPPNHYYEVWLLDPTTNKMLPLGLLSPKGSGTFSIAKSLMIQFPAVDVSLQANNGVAAHSNVSVLRGDVRTV
jgi:anti-sigma-K factor RskA